MNTQIAFTDIQANRFIEHLMECHSWYKHLPLLKGRNFIILIDENAGEGYPTQHPRLPFGNSQENYQEAFGFLNYFWQSDETYFHSDSSGIRGLSEEEITKLYEKNYKITLYPYISNNFYEAIGYQVHESDFVQIQNGKQHEMSRELILAKELNNSKDIIWTNFSKEDVELIRSNSNPSNNKLVNEYFYLEKKFIEILETLRRTERQKIRKAIYELIK